MEYKLNIYNERFRIIFESREHYRLIDDKEKMLTGEISGSYRNSLQDWPAVGDWVFGRRLPGENADWVLIEELQPRKNAIVRKNADGRSSKLQVLASNVDVLFIVTSANDDFNLNRIERYLTLVRSQAIQAVIVLNKVEMCEDPKLLLDQLTERFPLIPNIAISILQKNNLQSLFGFFQKGSTISFVGSSGVGKSSLTNYLLGYDKLVTSEIRESDSRGRHTTTHRELVMTSDGVSIIDTPGLRSVGLTEDTELDSLFADVENLFLRCKYKDCQHKSEPGCQVQAALLNGEIAEERWSNYNRMQREISFEKRKANKALMSEEKKKWAKRSEAAKDHKMLKNR